MKGLTSHELKKSKTKPIKHLKHTNMVRLFTKAADSAKKGYVEIHSSGFRDFLSKLSCFDLLWILVLNILPKVVDFGESGPVRCSRCKGYINPFMKFIDQERKFICNLCDDPQELEKYNDDNKELAWMFFIDGCTILQDVYMPYVLVGKPITFSCS